MIGNDFFEMTDPARPGLSCGGTANTTVTTEIGREITVPILGPRFAQHGNTWGDGTPPDLPTACVDAMYAAGAEWDMLRSWLGRNGIDGQGRATGIGVGERDTEGNPKFSASFFHEQFGLEQRVILGFVGVPADPEGSTPVPDPLGRQYSSMDIVAHEFGHMVFATTPGGAGDTLENGALNEGTSDIMAQLTIAFANNPKVPLTYAMGSQIGKPFRVMYNPSLGSEDGPMCYSPAIFTNPDGSPVEATAGRAGHEEAALLNRWFYLLAEGSNPAGGRVPSPTCDGSTLTGLGIKTAGQIWYQALLQKTPTWTYRDARSATLTAALRLTPGSCTLFDKVKAAWNAVSVPALPNEPTCGVVPPSTAAVAVGLPKTGAAPFTGSGPSGIGPRTLALLLLDALAVVGVAGASIVWLRSRRPGRRRS